MKPFYKKTLTHLQTALLLLATGLILSLQSRATPYTVNNTADGMGLNQLRGALTNANLTAGPHTITIAAGTYNLTTGISIPFGDVAGQNITITGADSGTTIINMNTSGTRDRIFFINQSGLTPNVTVSISNIRFTNGFLTTDPFGGGAILCGGPGNTTTITRCAFASNSINPSAGTTGGALNVAGGGTTSITQCSFYNNSNPVAEGGALYYFLGNDVSGSLNVTDCLFSNNAATTTTGNAGGAVGIGIQGFQGGTTSAINIQRNSFVNNRANAAGGYGGAISISNGFAGAPATAEIHYNRFAGNTATVAARNAVAIAPASGNVNLSNNWWGCNDGPTSCADKAALNGGTVPAGSTNTFTPHLQLRIVTGTTTLCSGAPGNTSVSTANFTTNSANQAISAANLTAFTGLPVTFTPAGGSASPSPTPVTNTGATGDVVFTANGSTPATLNVSLDNVPANITGITQTSFAVTLSPGITNQPNAQTGICTGNNATFTATASGSATLNYRWYKGATQLNDGATGNGSFITGATTNSLTITSAMVADNASDYKLVVTNGCGSATTSDRQLSVNAPSMSGTGTTTGSKTINATNTIINNAACAVIARVVPAGGAAVGGVVNATLTVDATVQSAPNGRPYLQRHVDLVPVTGAATATATITLYCTQAEFNAFNAFPFNGPDLPTGPGDAAGISNLRIYQYHGTGTLPGNYTGTSEVIDPADNQIIWNSTLSRWEITFSVNGFSGFFIGNQLTILPLDLLTFSGSAQGGNALLNWTTAREVNTAYFEIERSTDGIGFAAMGTITATGNGTSGTNSYKYADALGSNSVYYYRLKMYDKDGKFTYSKVLIIHTSKKGVTLSVSPNPFKNQLVLNVELPEQARTTMVLTDVNGRTLLTQIRQLQKGSNLVTIDQLANLAPGAYMLRIANDNLNQTVKVIKADQ